MKNSVDFKLLMYAIKGKNYVAELTNKTKQEYYTQDLRSSAKVLMDYYKANKGVPSFNILCDYLEDNKANYVNPEQTKQILEDIYKIDKSGLVDGDFLYLIAKLKKQYNDAFVKSRVDVLSQSLAKAHDINDINDYIKKTYFEINTLKANQVYAQGSLQETAKEYWLKYNETRENPDLAKGIYSGFRELDSITNGFRDSEVIVVSGPTGSGKSIFLMNMGVNAWLGNNKITAPVEQCDSSGKNIWFVSIENPFGMMRRRVDSCISGIGSNKLRDGTWTLEEDGLLLKQSLSFQSKYNKQFYVSDLGRGVTMDMVEADFERLISSSFIPDLIVIDYLGIMDANDPTGKDWLDQGTNARDMCEFARKINKPILTASQLKSALRTNTGLRRYAGDAESVARSKMITDNININLHIDVDDEGVYGEGISYDESPYMKIILAKCRDSKKGNFVIGKEFWRQRVYDLDLTNPTSSTGSKND